MRYTYKTKGTCSREISFDLDDGIITNVKFDGGCNGNLKAISILVEGKDAKEISQLLRGNVCGMKSTSCADQLSRAIDEAISAALTESEEK